MALPSFLLSLLVLPFLTLLPPTQSQLAVDYYNETCPKFHDIMDQVVATKQIASPTTAAATLRLFFHDCMVEGCDASLLLASNAFNIGERDADINLSLPGDAFDVITRAKTSLELQCPGIVSCADILAVAARNLVTMVGGPFYSVRLGRKDGLVITKASMVEGHISRPNMSMTDIIKIFDSKGFTTEDMVSLSGAHTIGFSHCSQFSDRIFNFSPTSQIDPSLNPNYAEGLRKLCANYTKDPTVSAFNDAITPGKFDNMYYINLQRGLGLLASDQALALDPRTRPLVDLYADNQAAFFEGFTRAIEKVSTYKVKTGTEGEVRHRCDALNSIAAKQ
ncbi:peroxidase 6-like [Cornus florida]|uniref:peroxidase 6-like n=1 Tax=Cornus florida TaxID=4283 RepID=UPI00289CFCA5|nr:peroxidase 6-like [Cornus florida]